MRKILIYTLLILGINSSLQSQAKFQASFSYSGNTISFKIRPNGNITTGFAAFEFFVRVPIAAPIFTWGPIVENTTNFPGMGTNASTGGFDSIISADPSFRITHFYYTAPQAVTTSRAYTGGQEYEVFNVTVVGADPGTLNMQLVQSPDDDPFYVNIADQFGALLRVDDLTTIFYPTTNTSGDPYFLILGVQAPAPAFLKDFNVAKRGNTDASLNWTTLSEQNVSHFILERSQSETSGWTSFAEVKAKGNSHTLTKYSHADVNVYDGRQAAKVVFYRIRSVDVDGQEKLFPIRSLRFTAIGIKSINIYPNPAKKGFYLTVPLFNPSTNTIRLNMVNRLGQTVHAREISTALASNYYYNLETSGIIAGEYMLQIIYNGDVLETMKVVVTR